MTPIPDNVVDFSGPLFLGLIFNWFLFGVITLQIYTYLVAFPNDKFATKSVAIMIYLIEVAQSIMSLVDGFRWFGRDWGNMDELNNIGLSWFGVLMMGPLVAVIVQIFYAWRIWILSSRKNPIFPILIVITGLFQCAAGVGAGVALHQFGQTAGKSRNNLILLTETMRLAGTSACDVLITICMVYWLMRLRLDTNITSTARVLLRLRRYTIETGLVTSVTAITDLILFNKYQTLNIHLTPCYILTKVYSISFLAVLNSRVRFVPAMQHDDEDPSLTWVVNQDLSVSTHSGGLFSREAPTGVIIHKSSSFGLPSRTKD